MKRRRRLLGGALAAASAGWAAYWGMRFFDARGEAEAAMDRLQPLVAAGLADSKLAAEVDAALAESHRALAFAIGGPFIMLLIAFAALWFFAGRGS
jgi:hypothetical protein